jgi:phosphoribosylglycinamide formyltransferase 1
MHLHAAIQSDRLRDARIDSVVSSRARVAGVKRAHEAGLPVTIIRPIDYPSNQAFSATLAEHLRAVGVDLVVMAGFLVFWDFPPDFNGRIINIHPALLPRFGGQGMHGHHVHEAVIAAGVPETGCTVHLVDHEYDHGPVLAQTRVARRPDDTPESLAERVQQAERDLYPRVIQQVADHGLAWLTTTAQRSRQTSEL